MKTALVGYSGHGIVVVETAIIMGIKVYGYTDHHKKDKNPFDLKYIGNEKTQNFLHWDMIDEYILGIGSNFLRDDAFKLIKSKGKSCLKVINETASISKYSSIGEGTFIARSVSINPLCQIGDYCIINTASSIDHECLIENGAHIAPGSVLCGNVIVGKNAFIGANSVVKEGVKIGSNSIIGAGSVVLSDVKNNSCIHGVHSK